MNANIISTTSSTTDFAHLNDFTGDAKRAAIEALLAEVKAERQDAQQSVSERDAEYRTAFGIRK